MEHETLKQRILDRVRQDKKTGCWVWTWCVDDWGYGRIWIGKKYDRAHRVAYSIFIGKIPSGMCVLHRCDVPACCRPEHLWLGTNKENIQDKVRKGRQSKLSGIAHGRAKLSGLEIKSIRKKYAVGNVLQRELAVEYGIAQSHVSRIIRGESWV